MSADSENPPKTHVVGEALQAAMAERGCDLTLEESRRFAITLIDLIASGLLVADIPAAGSDTSSYPIHCGSEEAATL